jgi:hypothetical protein
MRQMVCDDDCVLPHKFTGAAGELFVGPIDPMDKILDLGKVRNLLLVHLVEAVAICKPHAPAKEVDAIQPDCRIAQPVDVLVSAGIVCHLGFCVFVADAAGWKIELRTAKTGVDVYCVISEEVAEAVLNQPGKYPFWTGESNAEDCAATWRKAFARLFKQAGIKGHIHQFRHTFAKRLLLEGASLEHVSQLLGHASIEVTQRHYNKWILERQQDLEAVTRKIVVTYRSRGKIKPLEPA